MHETKIYFRSTITSIVLRYMASITCDFKYVFGVQWRYSQQVLMLINLQFSVIDILDHMQNCL